MKLRKLIAVLAAMLMLCSLIPAGAMASAAAVNLIENGDFEAGNFNTGWDQSWYAPSIVTDVVHGGTYAMKTANTASQYQTMIKTKAITVEANTSYTVTFWYYYDGSGTDAGAYLYAKGNASTNISHVIANGSANPRTWQKATLEFNSGSYTSVTLFLQNKTANTGGTFYFDDVSMIVTGSDVPEPEPEPTYTNFVENGGFEAGNFNTGWDQSWYAPAIVTNPVHSGTYAMKTGNTASQYQTMIKSKAIALTANTDYTLTFWYYYEGSATNAAAYVFIKGNGSTDIKNVVADASTAGVWKQATVTFNTGSYASVTLFFQNKTANSGGAFYFDDVMLYDPNEFAEPDPEPEPEPDPEPEGPKPVPVVPGNVMSNGTFETGATKGWTVYGDTKASADAAYTGNYGAELSSNTSWGSLMYTTVPVEEGVNYTVSFWYKAVAENVNFQIKDGNSGGAALVNETLGAPGWTKMTYKVTSSAAALYINFFHNSSTTKNLIYVDDIQVYPSPILQNGDFETGDNTGWVTYSGSTVIADAKKNGNYGMKLMGSGNWGSMANQDVTVEAGKTYVVSAWMKVVATGANMQIKDGGSSGTLLASGWHDKTDWTYVAHVVTPATNKLHVNFHSSGKNVTETVYLDDVSVVEIADDGLLQNGSFETGSISPWTVYYGTNTSSAAAYSGSYGAHLKGDGGWGAMIYQDFPTETGKKYNFSAYFKAVSNGANIQVKDVNGGTVTDIASYWYNGTEWAQVSIEFVAQGTTSRINVCGGGNGIAESVYMDGATVIEVKDPSYDGYIYNGDFEAGSLTKWNVYQSTEISGEAAYTGDYGAKMIGDGSWGATLNQTFDLEVGKTYKISFWYKAISNGVNYTVKGDVDGKNLASAYLSTGSTGAKWVYLEKTFQSAYNTSATLNFSGSGKETKDEVWIDDIKIENLSGDEMDRCDNLDNGGISIRDTDDDNRGLAFRFFLNANNTQYVKGNQYVGGTGTVKLFQYDEAVGTLLETGAVVSNQSGDNLTLDAVDGKTTIKVAAKYLLDWEEDAIGFAVRIINIPDRGVNTEVYARPYYTYQIGDEIVTIYGDVISDNYADVETARRTKRVLMVGDAATYGMMDTYLYDVLKSAAYDQVILGHLDGTTYHKNDDNGVWTTSASDAATVLTDERWQYVVVTNDADLEWAIANKPFGAQVLYYNATAATAADGVIPAATTLANLNTVRPAATEAEKEYAVTVAWYLALTGETLDIITEQPDEIVSCYFDLCRAAAQATNSPYSVTDLTETVLLAGGDYQMQTQAAGDPDVTPLLSGAKPETANGLFDGFFFIGDYGYGSGHDVATAGTQSLDAAVSDVVYGNKVYTEGNHDAPTVELISPTGPKDPLGAPYGVFVINENDYSAYGGGSAAVANQLTAYFNEKVSGDWGNKPIFVLCHVPLHYSRRTIDESCAKNALPLVEALNAGGEAGLNIIFLFGHNHSGDYDAYVGGGSIYLAKGDSILVADPASVKNAPSEVELNFTYMNAGYVGYYANHGSEADRTLTMTTFRIQADGSVIVSRYAADGLHNLKAKGVLNDRDLTNTYIVGALDETVYGPQRVVTATSDEPYEE